VTPHITIKDGDLLDQPVEVIVNAWNRNFIPWWMLLPQGVSGAIKRRAGRQICSLIRVQSRMIHNMRPNERTSGNGAVALSFHVERLSRAVPECER
jgi:O-acetyl-ADP-ribose deacetylase (regulator of RNase III)